MTARKKPQPRIEVAVNTLGKDMYEPAEWNAQRHHWIDVACTLDPDAPGYTHQELLGLYRWHAGIIARTAIWFHQVQLAPDQAAPRHAPPLHRRRRPPAVAVRHLQLQGAG